MKKEDYCSAMHGDPYPPCWDPNWHCEDCKKQEDARKAQKELTHWAHVDKPKR